MGYIVFVIIVMAFLLYVGRAVVCDIRNPHKGPKNEEELFENIPKVKTRNMYSCYER